MGLSLTRSLQELATRTETGKQAGVALVSFIKGGGGLGEVLEEPTGRQTRPVDGELLREAFSAPPPSAPHVYVDL